MRESRSCKVQKSGGRPQTTDDRPQKSSGSLKDRKSGRKTEPLQPIHDSRLTVYDKDSPFTKCYYFVYKPFQVLCQFSAEGDKKTLKDFFTVPKDVYPVGRLDYDSEGALLLTNDTSINQQLLNPIQAHEREYWVQVEGSITDDALQQLTQGVMIAVDGKMHPTRPTRAIAIPNPPVPERNPPIRFRKNVPDSWLSLTLTEGKNRQVRRMTATVGFPTLRLIRYRIGQLTVEGMQPGDMRLLTPEQVPLLFSGKK